MVKSMIIVDADPALSNQESSQIDSLLVRVGQDYYAIFEVLGLML